MEKTLIITEKPSVAADISRALDGKFAKHKNHYESKSTTISYAVGHLLTICEPQEIDPKYKSWSLKNLPIIPKEYKLKPIEKTKSQLKALQQLVKDKEVTHIINACDAGREGELIFRYIMQYCKVESLRPTKRLSRLWLQSMTPSAIRSGFDSLRRDEELQALSNAAKSRSEADWLIGINGSRGLTSYISQYGGFSITPCGRVQTPTLSMIVKREIERQQFRSQDFWTLVGHFQSGDVDYEGLYRKKGFKKDPKGKNPHDNANRLWTKTEAQAIADRCLGHGVRVEETSKESFQQSPLLYDLTSLQREANMRFGFSAKRTLSLAQALYERHKVLTYPRTDSRYLPEDMLGSVRTLFRTMEEGQHFLGDYAKEILEKNYLKPQKRIFDNKRVSDHHAIVPTNVMPGKTLPEGEMKIYTMVAQRVLAIFYPSAKYEITTRLSIVQNKFEDTFRTEGKILKVPGWKKVYAQQETEKLLKPLDLGVGVQLKKVDLNEDKTKPPARFKEASLLAAMEGAGKFVENEELQEALKERGLGTPATRAQIIEKLISDKYVVREDRLLVPTTKSFELMRLLEAMNIENLSSPELTGDWEYKLGLIERNQLSRQNFMNAITEEAKHLVTTIQNFDESSTQREASFSPLDGVRYYETLMRYTNEDKTLQIKKMMGGRMFSDEEIAHLLTHKSIGPLEGFRSKRGNPFTASIVLEDGKATFVFANDKEDLNAEEVATTSPVVGRSPFDGSEVFQTTNAYISKSELEKKDTGLHINRVILGKEIDAENFQKLLKQEKTDLIEGFRSAKTKRLFDAYLELDDKGKVKFSFPERKPSKASTSFRGGRKRSPASPPASEDNKEDLNAEEVATTSPVVGRSPFDGSEVFQTTNAYISKSELEKKGTGLRIGRVILGRELDLENLQKMLARERTNLIEGFRSAKTKRLFDAYLELDDKGKVQFFFPERKAAQAEHS